MTAAHRKLPMNTRVRVTHAKTGRSVVVRINDRGPYGSKKRIIDVSEAAAKKLGIIDEGVAAVKVDVVGR
jgi:rare lipoprotein A